MTDLPEFLLWSFSLISLLLHFLHLIRNLISMTLSFISTSSPSPTSSGFSWWRLWLQVFNLKRATTFLSGDDSGDDGETTFSPFGGLLWMEDCSEETSGIVTHEKESAGRISYLENLRRPPKKLCYQGEVPRGLSYVGTTKVEETMAKARKRPAKLLIPEQDRVLDFDGAGEELRERETEVEGKDFCLASRRGIRKTMEDGYGVLTDISGDSKHAFFGVFDGHGGRAAVEFAAENLGKNIVRALGEIEEEDEEKENHGFEEAVRVGYLTTDKEFLAQGLCSGACAATVVLKDGELHTANAGDCRVVLCRKGVAEALTADHRLEREDERIRIENSGGYVTYHNGVWRVEGCLAVSRAIGDSHLKALITSEPETKAIQLTSDCHFLIIASDGLWDKVTNQEAVDVVLRQKSSMESCKELVGLSCKRGNRDDITVMVVDLSKFCTRG